MRGGGGGGGGSWLPAKCPKLKDMEGDQISKQVVMSLLSMLRYIGGHIRGMK